MNRKLSGRICAAALCFACVFVFAGCGGKEAPSLKTSFKASFECEYSGLTITGSISSCGKKLVTISVDSPETLEGLTVEYKGGEVDFSRDSLMCTADEAYLPQNSFPSLTGRIFTAIQSGGAMYEGESGDLGSYSLTMSTGTAHITADKNGFVRTASIDGTDYKLVLSDSTEI